MKRKEVDYKRINVSNELIKIIELEKQKIMDYAHECIKVSDIDATKLIAKKYLEANLQKESIIT
jgi:hypothetical protein